MKFLGHKFHSNYVTKKGNVYVMRCSAAVSKYLTIIFFGTGVIKFEAT